MEMKDIAVLLCNLPEGNYKVETKIGSVEVGSVWSDNKDLRIINIILNGKNYDEITYSCFDYIKLYEKINFENNGKPYKLTHNLVDLPWDVINYKNENGHTYEITSTKITNKSDHNITYNVKNGVCISPNDDIVFTKNLETNEKLLYIKRFDCEKSIITLENDYICIPVKNGYKKLISDFNNFVNSFKNDNLIIDNEQQKQLINSIKIPTIDLNRVERLASEIDKYAIIYKEFASKLNKYHSEEILKTLESVALKLHGDYIKSKQEQKQKAKKLFDISKFKNK